MFFKTHTPPRRAFFFLAQGTTNELFLFGVLIMRCQREGMPPIHRFGCRSEAVLMSRVELDSASNIWVLGIMLREKKENG